jgi:nucleotide-binding universal stress UspA family protein
MSGVVVGYVAKPEGRAALRKAVEEAKRRNVPLLVVSSVQTTKSVLTQRSPGFEEELGGVNAELQSSGIAGQVRQLAPDADFAEELLTTAAEAQADLIVIALRRRSPIGKLLLGRNAQRVLLDARCPVLTVKAEG